MYKKDYKKVYKDIYIPTTKPMLINIPCINYIIVEGKGDPNKKQGEYAESIKLLYSLSYNIKMSKMGKNKIEGYFEYVVPPLEGLWWIKGDKVIHGIDPTKKDELYFISMIRQPEFVTQQVFESACAEVKEKSGIETQKAKFINLEEGLCVQTMHKGPYDNEPETIKKLDEYIEENNLINDIGNKLNNGFIRRHHEIYLSDPRRTKQENLRTVLRIPVRYK